MVLPYQRAAPTILTSSLSGTSRSSIRRFRFFSICVGDRERIRLPHHFRTRNNLAKANKRVQFGHGLNYRIDIENAVIVGVEPTPARTYDEVEATKNMLDRTERRFALKPKRQQQLKRAATMPIEIQKF